jgi:hypothetical protein
MTAQNKSKKTILDRWGISADYFTEVINDNPSLRGMILGYVAERKLRDLFETIPGVSGLRKDDDHDREKKGDLVVVYKGHEIRIEVKSLQTNHVQVLPQGSGAEQLSNWLPMVRRIQDGKNKRGRPKYRYVPNPDVANLTPEARKRAHYTGAVQCDASDRRSVALPNGQSIETTCLLVGEFHILAAGLFSFREEWDFGFALNEELPRSTNYPADINQYLLATLIPVTWPLKQPFSADPVLLLDTVVDRQPKKPSTSSS